LPRVNEIRDIVAESRHKKLLNNIATAIAMRCNDVVVVFRKSKKWLAGKEEVGVGGGVSERSSLAISRIYLRCWNNKIA
jgi:hypothetical protein